MRLFLFKMYVCGDLFCLLQLIKVVCDSSVFKSISLSKELALLSLLTMLLRQFIFLQMIPHFKQVNVCFKLELLSTVSYRIAINIKQLFAQLKFSALQHLDFLGLIFFYTPFSTVCIIIKIASTASHCWVMVKQVCLADHNYYVVRSSLGAL